MLDAGVNAAPVATIQSLINDAANLYVDPVTLYDFVINLAQQFQNQTLISHIRICSVTPSEQTLLGREIALAISPGLGFVLPHLLQILFAILFWQP